MPPVSLEMLDATYQDYGLSFDGAVVVSTRRGSCECILWKLPVWQVVKTKGHILVCVTANDPEYHGRIRGLKLALKFNAKELVAIRDSRIVDLRKNVVPVKLIHVKREFNPAAGYLTSKTPVLGESSKINGPDEIVHLRLVSRIAEKILKPLEIYAPDKIRKDQVEPGVRNSEVGIPESLATAAQVLMMMSSADSGSRNSVEQARYQDELKEFAKISDPFVLDLRDALYRLSAPTPARPRNKQSELRLVVPESLPADILNYSHEDFKGGHQDINRTFERLRSVFYLFGMYANVQKFVIAFGTAQPESKRGNTYLLPFQDQFSGYVMSDADPEAQDVDEAYEECVFRRFGANSQAYQNPCFMSTVFARFRSLLKSKQRSRLGYRPQSNGQQERLVQTVMRSVRGYVADID
ncbi:LOW QUALITY PROTEIN: reverse transcriptase [Phytophthora megakarya]|uniref:Reverse transcriptase n=1 Tax=Phytophthora megakarya TaxID=4795 RepID=A0A225WBY6_9STRA|nr:LOW QUALITY PROTEIN: reverse transcriptase [Phytophthora megakarya]